MACVIIYQGRTRHGEAVECSCGKATYGGWDASTLNEIAHHHTTNPSLPMIQSVKFVMTGDTTPWSPSDSGYPWKAIA